MSHDNPVRAGYDTVADEYTRRLYHELTDKPFDRKMLDWLVERVAPDGLICDVGCGPGQVARYLAHQGATVCGIDLSDAMVQKAKDLNPDICFTQGDMLHLTEIADETFAGVAAFYSIIHIPRPWVVNALREIHRTMQIGAVLLLTFHIGDTPLYVDEWWGHAVSMEFQFFTVEEMKGFLVAENFVISEVIQREPYPDVETQTKRAYIFARKA